MLNWDDLRIFLTVTRHRTLSSAAKQLNVTQSTVGRRLNAMELSLGVRLLTRTPDGFKLTAAGEAMLPDAKRAEAAAVAAEQAVIGQDAKLEGVVRVAAAEIVASHLLPGSLAGLHTRNPAITVEVLARATLDPVARRRVDLSLQLQRFEENDLIVRNLGTMQFGLYASGAYLDRCGTPVMDSGCAGQQVVTVMDVSDLPQHAAWIAECMPQAKIILKSDSYETQHSAAVNGNGLALLPRFRGDAEPRLQHVATPIAPPPAEIWLGVQPENRQNPRVRTVLDSIAADLRTRAADLNPAARLYA